MLFIFPVIFLLHICMIKQQKKKYLTLISKYKVKFNIFKVICIIFFKLSNLLFFFILALQMFILNIILFHLFIFVMFFTICKLNIFEYL